MDIKKLSKIDLNLLVSLQILIEECSVSAAARRMSITQPAMSKTLGRLRDTFNDPLFVRSKRGIQPTPRAQAIAVELPALLAATEALLDAGDFSPNTYRGEITIAISEYVGLSLLPPLTARLQKIAPGLSLRTITRVEGQLDTLAAGGLDFAVQLTRADYPEEFRFQSLGGSPLAVFVRDGHPLTNNPLTREGLTKFPAISLYVSDRNDTELPLSPHAQLQSGSVTMLETSHLLTALEILRETDFTLVCPAYLARNQGATRDVVALPLPQEEAQHVDYSLVAHRRTQASPVHQWLWNEIVDTVRGMRLRTVHRG
ncbi:MAG: LysR family transcriptional regulator [Luminiphilus sp.]|jgi:DNA-binding transcriptional LysR family regulator|nr:LysR family transcriptional regulator [Luminiphilus sp.]MDG1460781.1 LysR family transcriptional regulator [Luminiphilus sp.]